MGSVEQRLAALEQRVAALQAQVGGGEQLSANYLTVDPQGLVGAMFTGLISALGIFLPSSPSFAAPAANSQIVWTDAGGAQVASIIGFEDASIGETGIALQGPAGLDVTVAVDKLVSTGVSRFLVETGGLDYIILNDAVESDFARTNTKAATATAGAAALPAAPAGFVVTKDTAGNTLKIPYYNA